MKRTKFLALLLAVLILLSACGGSSASYKADYAVREEAAPEAPMAMDAGAGINSSLITSGPNGSTAMPQNRKWIITVDMNAETDDLDTMLTALDEKILSMNGYVENQNIYNGSSYANRRYRNANLTIRVPAADVEAFTQEVAGISNVVRKQTSKEDVTLSYVDTESRKQALETEEARLLELLAEAETMADLLEIEARLTDVRYELENFASQLRLYDNQVDYATVYLYISEVQEYTPVEDPTFLERIQSTFSDSLEGLGDGVVDITVFLVGNSPYLLVFGLLAFVIFRLAKRPGKWFRFRQVKKEDQK